MKRLSFLVVLILSCGWSFTAKHRLSRYSRPLIQLTATVGDTDEVVTSSSTTGALSMTVEELAEPMGGIGRARLAWDCYRIGVDPCIFFANEDEMGKEEVKSIRKLFPGSRRTEKLGRPALEKLCDVNQGLVEGDVASLSTISTSRDGTTKLLLKLRDDTEVETVIIPWNNERSTLCISSQVGCRQGCKFCATGKMGKVRSLTADEIIAQMFFAKKICRLHDHLPEIKNIVFMGMGEPADNHANVIKAVQILTKRDLFQLSAMKVTVSTVAPNPEAFAKFADAPCVLAWSVHAARDDLRKKLVPTTKYEMTELRQGLIDALLSRPNPHMRTTMLEVALMDSVNDSEIEADELAEFARYIVDSVPGCKLMVNLIPYNDIGYGYRKPSPERVLNFQKRLWSQGIYTHIRTTRGDDESAACGQLVTLKQRKKQKTP